MYKSSEKTWELIYIRLQCSRVQKGTSKEKLNDRGNSTQEERQKKTKKNTKKCCFPNMPLSTSIKNFEK